MRTFLFLIAAAVLLDFCAVSSTLANPVTYHVATDGDDANPGTQASPFRTIARAQQQVRQQIAGGLTGSVTVNIGGGEYELDEPLTFGPEDSGTSEYAVRYIALVSKNSGEPVVLSGGREVRDWHAGADGRWTAPVPNMEQRSGAPDRWFFRQLTVAGQRATRARWPNDDGELHIATADSAVTRFTFDQPLNLGNLAGQDAELVVYENWSVTRGRIVSADGEHISTATPMGWIGHGPATTASPGKPIFLEHALSLLDEPNEWYLDRKTGTLHYAPVAGADPNELHIVAPVLHKLLVIAGTADAPVRNLTFHGIRFEHADFPLPRIGYNEIQAAHYGTTLSGRTFVQPVAIECTHAVDCRFENCRIAHVNCSGIGIGVGCRRNEISGCTIEDIGGCGVMVGWRGKGKLTDGAEGHLDADWQNRRDAPDRNQITNCLIRRCGADSFGAPGIFVAFSNHTRIAHNELHDLPYTGISVGFRWSSVPTSQANCLIEANHIYDVMQKLADGGGIYTLGLQPGTVFRGNNLHQVHRSPFAHGGAPNNGFFIDEGSKGFVFESNVVSDTSGTAVRFNQSQRDWHTWRENFFGDGAKSDAARAIVKQAGREAE